MNYSIFRCIKTIPIFFFALTITAQGINDIKEKDTVFILFEQSKKFKEYTYNGGDIFKDCHKYTYYYSNSDYIVFTCCHMLDFDREAIVTKVKKKWLKKQVLITEDFFKQTTISNAYTLLSGKTLFIIELKNYKKQKVLIKQATFASSYQGRANDLKIEYEEIKN